MYTTQLILNGTASQGQIAKTFGLSLTTVKRCVKKFRERGSKAFYHAPAKRQGRKLNPERLAQAQLLLDQGRECPPSARNWGVLASTLHKTIDSGRLHQKKDTVEVEMTEPCRIPATTKSQRSVADQQALMGVATTRSCERLFAVMGLLESAPIVFEVVDDVPLGGVMRALPALLGFGLLRHTRLTFSLPNGFYPIETNFLVLAFLALARILILGESKKDRSVRD